MRPLLGCLVFVALVGTAAAAPEPKQLWLAAKLDREGKLDEALPLYRTRAEETESTADRLRYAAALLRAGKMQEARDAYSALMIERNSVHHGGEALGDNVPLCASSALMNGFPALAVEYIRPVYRAHPGDATSGLLLARALVAAGDVDGAREVVHDLGPQSESLVIGQRIELARAYFLTGDVGWARRLLEKDIEESVGLMMRDSILTNVTFKEGRWSEAATALADAKRKAPATLGEKRVSRAWRNLQREVWSIQLRRAIALWNAGKHEDAVDEASAAQEADDEYVRSGAILFVSAARLASGLRGDALVRLHALAGHDVRFNEPIAHLDAALAKGGDLAGAIAGVRAALSAEDRAQDFVTAPLFEIVTAAARGTKPLRTESASR